MQTKVVNQQEALTEESVLPITVEVTTECHGEEGCREVTRRQCHAYRLASDNSLELFKVDAGRLRTFCVYIGVLSLEEIDG